MRMTADQLDELELVLSNEGEFYKDFTRRGDSAILCHWIVKVRRNMRDPHTGGIETRDAKELLYRFREKWDLPQEPETASLLPHQFPPEDACRNDLHCLLGTLAPGCTRVRQGVSDRAGVFIRNVGCKDVAWVPQDLYRGVHEELRQNMSTGSDAFWAKLLWTLLVHHRGKLEWFSSKAQRNENETLALEPYQDRFLANLDKAEPLRTAYVTGGSGGGGSSTLTPTGRRVVDHTPSLQSIPKSFLAFQKETIFATTPKLGKSQESNMTNPIEIKTVVTTSNVAKTVTQTFINNRDAASYSDAELYELIEDQENKIEDLDAIKSKPLGLVAEIEKRKASVASLVAHLDAKFKAENPDYVPAPAKRSAKRAAPVKTAGAGQSESNTGAAE